jgi:TatA/E family protein of Tat protein translocase
MFGIGTEELLVVLVIILVLFGGKQLPELSRNVGKALGEIRKGLKGDDTESDAETKPKEKKSA